MFDTHCHLNFKAYGKNREEIIRKTRESGVSHVVVPGTNVDTSQAAVLLADTHEGIYASVGIHPHHVFELYIRLCKGGSFADVVDAEIEKIRRLVSSPKVVAVGELGLDRHMYVKTKYEEYHVTDDFVGVQKEVMIRQIYIALEHDKSVIIHNREASLDLLKVMEEVWDEKLRGRAVFHCCEPNDELLNYAVRHGIYIGVDGDITYDNRKKSFIQSVPEELLVLETDGPYLLPEPLRSQKAYPNAPYNLEIIAETVARWRSSSVESIKKRTAENGKRLFGLP